MWVKRATTQSLHNFYFMYVSSQLTEYCIYRKYFCTEYENNTVSPTHPFLHISSLDTRCTHIFDTKQLKDQSILMAEAR